MSSHPLLHPAPARRARLVGACALVVAAICVALVAGWRLGSALIAKPAPPPPRSTTVGPLRVVVPPIWRAARGPAGIPLQAPGFRATAFDAAPGLDLRALLFAGQPADASLLPAVLRSAAAPGALLQPLRVWLGGHRAWQYTADLAGHASGMQVTVVPTTAGVVGVACVAPALEWPGASACGADLTGVALDGAKPLAPAPDTGFRLRLPGAVRELSSARARDRATLLAARTAAAQVGAARALSADFARAATDLQPFARGSDAALAVTAALTRAPTAYRELAAAATSGTRPQFARARGAVEVAEAAVRTSLADRPGVRPG